MEGFKKLGDFFKRHKEKKKKKKKKKKGFGLDNVFSLGDEGDGEKGGIGDFFNKDKEEEKGGLDKVMSLVGGKDDGGTKGFGLDNVFSLGGGGDGKKKEEGGFMSMASQGISKFSGGDDENGGIGDFFNKDKEEEKGGLDKVMSLVGGKDDGGTKGFGLDDVFSLGGGGDGKKKEEGGFMSMASQGISKFSGGGDENGGIGDFFNKDKEEEKGGLDKVMSLVGGKDDGGTKGFGLDDVFSLGGGGDGKKKEEGGFMSMASQGISKFSGGGDENGGIGSNVMDVLSRAKTATKVKKVFDADGMDGKFKEVKNLNKGDMDNLAKMAKEADKDDLGNLLKILK